ncbi:MAG: ABC transporter substrate-binding protein [archaeon]
MVGVGNKVGVAIIAIVLLVSAGIFLGVNSNALFAQEKQDTIKIGWISDLSGSGAKYGAYEAGLLAVEEINAKGGINGKKIELIVEDGKCNSKTAVDAMNKLVNIDKVKFVLGGHCSPETIAIAPLAEENKVIVLASISTSPVITSLGDYVFRTSPVSVIQSDLLANLAVTKLKKKKVAIIYSQTDYAKPIAEKMKERFPIEGGQVVLYEGFLQNSTDFRSILAKVQASGADLLFLSPQNSDEALNLLKQVKELNIQTQIFGNDQLYNVKVFGENRLNEGVIIGAPEYSKENALTKKFTDAFVAKYKSEPPFGIWTAESYDGVYLLAEGISKYGEDTDKVKEFIYSVKDWEGASGKITIDKNGDGVREYSLKLVKNGLLVGLD